LYVDNPFDLPTVLSFCPGILGLERGLERAIGKIRVVAYVEIEAFIIANLLAGMEEGFLDPCPIWTDVKTFNGTPFRGKVNGIIGGYPCQPFSNAGLQRGGMDPRHLWPFIRQHIETIQPDWCFFENVSGHLTIGYPEVRQSLETLGYTVKEGIFSAEEVGAPHRRDRLYILAIKLVYTCKDGRNGSENGQSTYSRNDGNATGAQQLFEPTGRSCAWDYEELANTYGNESGTRSRTTTTTTTTGGENENTQRGTNGERLRAQSGQCDSTTAKLADADLQQREGQGRIQQRKSPGWNSASFSGTKWPAGQGPFQYDWEHPRAVEPGLGVTVDGYNFRSDLLRACGNSVVEQTAELAFITLFLKHYPLTDLEDDI
jgi:DNA (cytosine-5)-methyltransferase 1